MPDEAEKPDLVFVYGTLRPGLAAATRHLVDDLEQVGSATVRGLLFDLGNYPGMIAGDGVVYGDLLRLGSPNRLSLLDEYEECGGPRPLFWRQRILARQATGEIVSAWTYLYARSITGAARIPEGDYATHLRELRPYKPLGASPGTAPYKPLGASPGTAGG